MDWAHTGPTVLASFLASMVECVEALTVVLAVGVVRGWRSAFTGSAAALFVLLLLVLGFGRSLSQIPLPIVRIVIGTLLLMFGLRWLRKAILRSAGIIKLHDETAAYVDQMEELRRQTGRIQGGWDITAIAAAFKIVMLEGIEVVFIVIALGASGQLIVPASIGALAALLVVVLLGLLLHRPLANIPENALKFGVGVLLAGFGTFWVGEGIHLDWPGHDWAIVALSFAYFGFAYLLVLACRAGVKFKRPNSNSRINNVPIRKINPIITKTLALFVDDGNLALGIVAWVFVAWLGLANFLPTMFVNCLIFFVGFVILLAYSVIKAAGKGNIAKT